MGIFSPDSKFMKLFGTLAELMLLNMLYLICCIPLFTVGAAQAGLYTGLRNILEPDSEGGYVQAFFRGFRSGFGRITLAWLPFMVIIGLLVWSLVPMTYYQGAGFHAPVWAAVAGICVCAVLSTVMTLFHARFSCSAGQLIRNAVLVTLRFPVRSICAALLIWLPVLALAFYLEVFLRLSIALALIYFSMVFVMNISLFKKPFQILTDHFMESQ